MHGSCHENDDEQNGSKAVTLLLRLANMALAITAAAVMATASSCTINKNDDATTSITVTFKDYQPFGYMIWSNIAAAVLQAAGIYLQLAGTGEDDDEGSKKLPKILLVLIDVAVQALLYSATGAVFSGEVAYQHEIKACVSGSGRFCDQVHRSKLFSLGASLSIGFAAAAKDIPLPFSVWPLSSSSSDC
ncbi:hypothetical protein PR202_ga22333 [Eleusine coracana subsp. coracana]|uniref:CASP-like protein n=1 Tax=Eleusine coracana subsp. coracana TaxID=191504 RepID=A0AAV5D3A0_ELECO|nr:hypothetical protein PR202_ga22333 [Eleusine coracana subsp. coracana]